ncbi:uncharacterized protein LOC113863230 isoform X2 [Abrus precatorius]|uniref:Uncharacterized protein LOC113863230 isoform X2 n=1 Tax=Abrus precatorius TaxID=3816 RepID=A0A8B8LB91_ABRPR|nr:uncharacterized protein LOC113863230 isoform X2 [Abrus precatorius]
MQTGNVANSVLDAFSSSFVSGNEAFSNDILKPASNISDNKLECSSPFFCSDGAHVGAEARNKTLKQRDVTGNGARNLRHRSGFSNDKIKRNIRFGVGFGYTFARKVPIPLCAASVIADNFGTMNSDYLFQRYWGLRKNASANWSIRKSRNQNINQKECSEDVNLSPISDKSEPTCYRSDLSDKKTMPPQLSSSSSSILIDSQILQERCLMNDEMKNKMHKGSKNYGKNAVTPDSSVDCLVYDNTEVVERSQNNPTKQQSKSTAFILSQGDIDSLSCSSYASKLQDTSDFQEDSVHSLFSEADPESLHSFEEAYEPSPISVLNPSFRDGILLSSKCGDDLYDSSEVDDEEFGLNVSSDGDCGNESIDDCEEKKDIEGLFRVEESRDFSYVVEVLTEAGISNRNLFTDFSTWYSTECPISPSVFEILEKKFGEQQLWKRSERRLLFDRINIGLFEILQPYLHIPMWEKPVSRRLNAEPSQDMIEEEVWGMLVAHDKKTRKDSENNMLGGEIRWTELDEDIEDIVREIVKMLMEELANEIVSLENI